MNPPNFSSPIQNLLKLASDLRGEGGCPWDQEQTHSSVIPHLLEEAYEVVDTIEAGDDSHLKEELGDLLFQVVFHCQLAKERGAFGWEDVVQGIFDKLVFRHPHVYGEISLNSGTEVLNQWDELKAKEKEMKSGNKIKTQLSHTLDGIPKALPAIQRSEKIQKKVAKQGFNWPTIAGVFEKFKEEIRELEVELTKTNAISNKKAEYDEKTEDELGDLFFLLVNLAQKLSIDPETCLRKANQKFERRFHSLEEMVQLDGKQIVDQSLEELDQYWEKAKMKIKNEVNN
ncbi:MAG: nucleoside triphosphate pyrophosphohydrolase [Leptospira sp.]|nr:nucleoside triphosphate pyrophosphohydrolase [Leptospira sp.]